MKKFTILASVLLASLVGCNKEAGPDNPIDAKEKNIYLKMENPEGATTRSDSESAIDQRVELTHGVVVFVNGDKITRYVNLSTTGEATYAEPTTSAVPTITISEILEGVRFTNITADMVYIIGNRTVAQLSGLPVQEDNGSVRSGSKMTDLIKNTGSFLNVTIAADMGEGVHSKAAIFGANSLVQDSGDEYKTTVTLSPIMARLEIVNIHAADVTFDLAGIFVNNYYTKARVDGVVPAATTIKNNLNVPANYVQAYDATALRDWSDGTLGSPKGDAIEGFTIEPALFWGYNVFAAKNVEAGDKNLPRIVLRLKNVKGADGVALTNGAGLPGDKFITVNGFNDGTNPVTEFKAGYVYTITSISFNKSNLTDEPEIADRVINATVKISINKWVDGGTIIPEI